MQSVLQKFKKQTTIFFIDFLIFFVLLWLVLVIRHLDILSMDYYFRHFYGFLPIFLLFFVAMMVADLYNVFDILKRVDKIKRIFYVTCFTGISGIIYFYLFAGEFNPKTILFVHTIFLFVFLSLHRIYIDRLYFFKNKIKAIMISDQIEASELISTFSDSVYSIDFVSQISENIIQQKSELEIKDLLLNYVKLYKVNLVIINTNDKASVKVLKNILFDQDFVNVRVLDIYELYEYVFRKSSLNNLSYKNLINSSEFDKDRKLYVISKRILEILIAIPVVIIWLLLHPFVYFLLKREIKKGIGQNVIFMTRNRMGKRGKNIKILKYRTMLYSDPGDKWLNDQHNQNAVTPFGEFLRKTRIDELPQILSVIKGDLSLVGPRQDEIGLYNRLKEEIPNYDFRYIVTPGLSGWAQTMMNIQPKSIEETRLRFAYDMYYIKNQSIFLDIIILLRTIKTLLSREG